MRFSLAIFISITFFRLFAQSFSHHKELILMGSRFEITAVSDSEALSERAVENAINEIRRIERLLSEYDPQSQVSEINRKAGIEPVKVSYELFSLTERCMKVSALTDGAFDISWAGATSIWKFDEGMSSLPTPEDIEKMNEVVGYENIVLNKRDTTIFLRLPGMKIGFGAIGKGYAANKATQIMKELPLKGGIVVAGGDLVTFGLAHNTTQWNIGIANPDQPDKAIAWFRVGETAVVTSGNYEKYVIIDGKKYTHIIDPRTCWPVSGLKSVTIICPDGELADALSTAVFVMGKDEGLHLINQLKSVECLIIDENNTIYTSNGLQLQYLTNPDSETTEQKNIFTIGH